VDTDLNITGKVAQFGRGALADVSDKLLLQFVDNLNALIAKEGVAVPSVTPGDRPAAAPSAAAAPATQQPAAKNAEQPAVRKIEQHDEVAPLDLLEAAGGTVLKRLTPVFIVIAVAVAAFVIFR
jgi:hypothetical protein